MSVREGAEVLAAALRHLFGKLLQVDFSEDSLFLLVPDPAPLLVQPMVSELMPKVWFPEQPLVVAPKIRGIFVSLSPNRYVPHPQPMSWLLLGPPAYATALKDNAADMIANPFSCTIVPSHSKFLPTAQDAKSHPVYPGLSRIGAAPGVKSPTSRANLERLFEVIISPA